MIRILVLGIILVMNGRIHCAEWKAEIPKFAMNGAKWQTLTNLLIERKMYYGALACAHRSLIFFDDLDTKTKAFSVIVDLIDMGDPHNHFDIMVSGDLVPLENNYDFFNSYYLYKALINESKNEFKWAKSYFEKIDQDQFPKYQFYQAIRAYVKGEYEEAIVFLKEILKKELPQRYQNLVGKAARTLARTYYRQEKFDKAHDIYENYLLKLNPIILDDWIEAAWSAYQSQQFSKAMGHLYNLVPYIKTHPINMDNFVIRALIYMKLCAADQVKALIEYFDKEFSLALDGIKKGRSLADFPVLALIDLPEHKMFLEIQERLRHLEKEFQYTNEMDEEIKKMAQYLYSTEIERLKREEKIYKERFIQASAKELVMTSESLKFLQFGVMREKFNPERVFKKEENTNQNSMENFNLDEFIKWDQVGDYWRDERNLFWGDIANQCLE